MSDPIIALFMLGIFLFIILLGFPVAFTLMAMGIMFGYYAYLIRTACGAPITRRSGRSRPVGPGSALGRGAVQQPDLRPFSSTRPIR